MSDTLPGSGGATDIGPPSLAENAPLHPAGVIAAGLGDRRNTPRMVVQLPCTVFVGSHVHDAVVRDVSPGGAMLNGVRGLLAHDLIRIRLVSREEYHFVAEVRGVSLLGVHVAILNIGDLARWQDAIRDLMTVPPERPV